MEFLKDLFVLFGRVCISTMFLWSAYEKVKHWNFTKSYMKTLHIPQIDFILPLAIGIKVIGALMVLLGWHAHIGAFFLLAVVVPSSIKLHAFWNSHGDDRKVDQALFMKDLGVIGGLLLLLALGAGHIGFGGGG